MSNIGNHIIQIFKDDKPTVKEYLKIAINMIIFHRWLNNNNYKEIESNINNISYIKIDNDSIDNDINSVLTQIDNYSYNQSNFQITINLYSKIEKKFYIFSKPEGLWEKWNLLVTICDNKTLDKENKIRKYISYILKEINSEKDFMPDLKLNDFENVDNKNDKNTFNFPYEIKLTPEFEQQSIISIFKNMNIKDSFDKMV